MLSTVLPLSIHALRTSQTCSFAKWYHKLHPKVAFEVPCSCARCGIKSFHDVILHPSLLALKNFFVWILGGDTVLSGTAVCMTEMHMLWGKQTNTSLEMYSLLQRWVCCRLLPGSNNRREGGQGVVVFATSKFTSDTYAIKFFVFQRHFEEERAMYQDGILCKVLPEVRSEIVLKSWTVNFFSKLSYFLLLIHAFYKYFIW